MRRVVAAEKLMGFCDGLKSNHACVYIAMAVMHPAKKIPRDFQWQGMILRWAKSVGVHTRLLDDRLPLVDFRLKVFGQRLGRGFVLAHGLRAKFADA